MKKEFDDIFIEWLDPPPLVADAGANVTALLQVIKKATSESAVDMMEDHPGFTHLEKFAAVMGCVNGLAELALENQENRET